MIRTLNRTEYVVEDNANKYDKANIVIVKKSGKTAGRLAVTCEPLVIGHQDT